MADSSSESPTQGTTVLLKVSHDILVCRGPSPGADLSIRPVPKFKEPKVYVSPLGNDASSRAWRGGMTAARHFGKTFVKSLRDKTIHNSFLCTNYLWFVITVILAVARLAFHAAAVYLDLYENPPHPHLRADVSTHSLNYLAVVAYFLNLNFGTKRHMYGTFPIGLAFTVGVVWEAFEEIVIRDRLGQFFNSFANAVQDLYINVLGGIVAAFAADELVDEKDQSAVNAKHRELARQPSAEHAKPGFVF